MHMRSELSLRRSLWLGPVYLIGRSIALYYCTDILRLGVVYGNPVDGTYGTFRDYKAFNGTSSNFEANYSPRPLTPAPCLPVSHLVSLSLLSPLIRVCFFPSH